MKRLFKITKISTAVAITAMVGALGSSAHADLWDDGGADSEFSTPANWDMDTFPPVDGIAEINGAFTVDRTVDSNVERTFVNGGGVLNVSSGTHSDSRAGNTIRDFIGTSGTGTVNVSGGTYDVGHVVMVGNGAGNSGTINVTGGNFIVGRGGNSFMGIAGGSSLEVAPSGGADGLVSLSGTGSFVTRIGVGVGLTGVFEVIGSNHGESGIGIGTNGSLSGSWTQEGSLRVGLDAGGITPIEVDLNDGSGTGLGNVTFASGSILDPYDAGSANNAWTTVMTWDGMLTDGGLALSATAVSAGWEMQVVGTELQVRNPNLPDPTTGELGDFDLDGDVDLADLDQYNQNIGAAAVGALANLDLDGDGTVDAGDFQRHYTELVETSNGQKGTFAGDVNLDGTVNVLGDAFPLVGNLNVAATSWSQGDLNADGVVNVLGDAFVLIGNLGNTNNP